MTRRDAGQSRRRAELEFLHAHGDCYGLDQEIFFPEDGMHATRAREICKSCPVRPECLDYATRWGETGVWGGMTERDRRREDSRRRRIAAA